MVKRRLFRISIGVGLLIGVAVGSWLVGRATVQPEEVRVYERVAIGMTEVEAARILEPCFTPSDHLDVLALDVPTQMIVDEKGQLEEMEFGQRFLNWLNAETTYGVQVAFNREGKATRKVLIQYRHASPILDRMRFWLGI